MKYCLYILILCTLYSCQSDVVFEKNIPINTYNWEVTDTLKFEVDVEDTSSKYDLSLNVRHRDIYDFMNLYVKIITILPNGEKKNEVVSLPLCDDGGKWLGKCSGDICFSRIILMRKIIFPQKGNYQFLINQEMRQENLKNILDLGLRLEKSKKKVYKEEDE